MRCILLPGLCAALGCAEQPTQVRVNIEAGTPVHTMRGGIGASFHAISADLPSRLGGGDSCVLVG